MSWVKIIKIYKDSLYYFLEVIGKKDSMLKVMSQGQTSRSKAYTKITVLKNTLELRFH